MYFCFLPYKHQRYLNINDAKMILGGCKAAIKINIIDLDFKLCDIGFNIKIAN